MDIARLIQSAVAPVFLLTGVAATLGVLTNRLARIVDRARYAGAAARGSPGQRAAPACRPRGAGAARALHQRGDLDVRDRALLVALVVVTLFANAFLRSELGLLIALLFVGAMVCLSAAFIAFFIEVRLATAALRIGSPGPSPVSAGGGRKTRAASGRICYPAHPFSDTANPRALPAGDTRTAPTTHESPDPQHRHHRARRPRQDHAESTAC